MDYQKHYDALMERGKTRILEGYKESHHIIPRCIGGSDDKENLVYLTAAEHYIAHQLLVKIYPNNHSLIIACRMMCVSSGNQIRNNKEFEWIKIKAAKFISSLHLGRKRSEETRRNISNSLLGRNVAEDVKIKISNTLKGKTFLTEEGKKKLSSVHTGKFVSEETRSKQSVSIKESNITVECPWCKKSGKLTGMKSWHFDRCKENPNGLQRKVSTN